MTRPPSERLYEVGGGVERLFPTLLTWIPSEPRQLAKALALESAEGVAIATLPTYPVAEAPFGLVVAYRARETIVRANPVA